MTSNHLPSSTVLAVDLDGTLIRGDVSFTSIFRLLQKNPLRIFLAVFWLLKGRPHLKRQIALRTALDPASFDYRDDVLDYLKEERSRGRKLVLATASDQIYADLVANHIGIFDEALGSDGITNLNAGRKGAALEARYGAFSYAGNSRDDLKVWESADEAIAVGVPKTILKELQAFKTPTRIFP